MTRDEHTAIINQIRENPADVAKVSTLLAKLAEDYNETLTTVETTGQSVEALTTENLKLLKSNNELFQLVGSKLSPFATQADNKNKGTNQDEDKKPSFDDLFDEKGNLK